jgi:hypothetical protein
LKKVLLVTVLAAAVLVPSASASRAYSVNLALVPLPKPALGSAAHALALAHDSGAVSNDSAASHTPDATAATLKKLGRVNGYALEYGNAFTGAAGVTDVHTGIEQYKTSADAKRGLAFWQKEDSKLGALNQPGFAVTNVLVKVPAVGTKRFAYLTSYSASNIAPLSGIDEQLVDGRYVLDVIVTAGSASTAKALAPKLAKKLDAGPPPGGPDLSTLALQASDLVGPATIDKQYVIDPAAISDYSVIMLPGGPFDVLDQEIEWYPAANEASFFADFENASALAQSGTTTLDLSSLGAGAQGSVTERSSISTGLVVFSTGRLAEFLFTAVQGSIGIGDVTSVAQAAANRIASSALGN